MTEPIAYLNGAWIPFSEATLSVADLGIVQAATVTEMIRTFGFRPFRVDEHLARLRNSLALTGIADPKIVDEFPAIVDHLISENWQLLNPSGDLGIVIFITAGLQPMYAGLPLETPTAPTVCVHSFPLPFSLWARFYDQGIRLRVPAVCALSPSTVRSEIKMRSRLHWFLADHEVHRNDPEAWALLADEQGHLTETNSGNLIVIDANRLRMPRSDRILGGVSQRFVIELAQKFGLSHGEEELTIADLRGSREAFLSSTTYCLLPVTAIDGQPVGTGTPGPMFRQLIAEWSARVGIDIVDQSRQPEQSPEVAE